jgi:antitoxin ParD1/3/4
MEMTSLNVSLPKTLKKYVEAQVKEGGYSTPSEYVRALVREDQKSKAEEKLETLLLEGLNSGEPIEVTPEFWRERRRELLKRLQKKSRR